MGYQMRKDLAPCSLCGGSPVIKSKDPVHRSAFRFRCTSCGLAVDKGYPTREEAIEAWQSLNALKGRVIDSFEVPDGYTLLPSSLFKEICDYIRMNNFPLFKQMAQYNIWHHNVPIEPPSVAIVGQQFIAND